MRALIVLVRRVRHVIDQRFPRRREHPVADQDFLVRRTRCARSRGRRTSRRARCRGTCSRSPGPRSRDIDDGAGRPVDVPVVAQLRIDAQHIDDVARAAHDALVVASAQDLRRRRTRPEGPVTSGRVRYGSMSLGGMLGIGVGVERGHARRRRQTDGVPARQHELRLSVDVLETHDVAGIDEMRIADLLAIHPPDFGPAPRFLQELAGDAPQRVALLHRVARWRTVGDVERLGDSAHARR